YSSVKFLKKIHYPIVCSKSLEKKWKKLLEVQSIENGIDILKYTPVTYDKKNEFRKKFNIPVENKIFIVSGVLTKRKNPLMIIEAFKRIELKNSILIFLGEGELYRECLNRARNEENIIFMGNVKDVSKYLKISDYYISASFAEGLPNSVLEAMATGLPCLLSNIPSHKEIGIGEKYLFNPKFSEELEEKIKMLITEDYTKLSILNRKIIEEKFSDKLMSKKYSDYYISE
ncbi:MAG: glycosyltransferase family 4 protein, partial [Cetobacterium sp.]